MIVRGPLARRVAYHLHQPDAGDDDDVVEVLEDLLAAAHLGVRALRGLVDLLAEAGLDGACDDVDVEVEALIL